jgi:hypothetical protein
MGVALVVAVELLGVRSLAFAVGSYLSIATTMAIFAGGVVHWLVGLGSKKKGESESEASPGALYSSGLIAAGGIFGLLAIILNILQDPQIAAGLPGWLTSLLHLPLRPDLFGFGPRLLGPLAQSSAFGVLMFALLSASLFYFARKKLS